MVDGNFHFYTILNISTLILSYTNRNLPSHHVIYTRQTVTKEISLTTTYLDHRLCLDDTWISENTSFCDISDNKLYQCIFTVILISGIDIQHFQISSVFSLLGEDATTLCLLQLKHKTFCPK